MNATITQNATLRRAAAVRTRDRRIGVAIAVFVPLVVFIGFARSYFLKAFFGFPPLPSLLVHVHGVTMTAWVALMVDPSGALKVIVVTPREILDDSLRELSQLETW